MRCGDKRRTHLVEGWNHLTLLERAQRAPLLGLGGNKDRGNKETKA